MPGLCRRFSVVLAIGVVFQPLVTTAAAQTAVDGAALIAAARRADGAAMRAPSKILLERRRGPGWKRYSKGECFRR